MTMTDKDMIEALSNEVVYLRSLVDRQVEEKKTLLNLMQRMYERQR